MSTPVDEEPCPQAPAEPPGGNMDTSGPFWDFKASHWVQVCLTLALVGVGIAQFCVYNRQASIMSTQANISKQSNDIGVSVQRAFVVVNGLEIKAKPTAYERSSLTAHTMARRPLSMYQSIRTPLRIF
jgi:hypothetical protein